MVSCWSWREIIPQMASNATLRQNPPVCHNLSLEGAETRRDFLCLPGQLVERTQLGEYGHQPRMRELHPAPWERKKAAHRLGAAIQGRPRKEVKKCFAIALGQQNISTEHG